MILILWFPRSPDPCNLLEVYEAQYHVMGLGKDPSAVEADLNFETQVKCIFLPWESAEESELQNFMPDIM